jgi:serine phosphatase RsbU (regulator of sigma subunit)
VVLILLAFATGNTDFHEASPFGEIPGGLIIASMISDIIDATWLRQVETAPLLIVLMAALGTALGINGSAGRFWVGFLLCSVLYTIICLYLFAAQSLVVPWFFPYLSFCSASLIYFAHVRLQEEFKLLSVERNYYSEKSMRLERETEKAKLEGYLSLGKAVQKLLLPETMVGQFHQFHYKMIYHPHMKMAGDWLFTWPVAEHEYRIIIGDVMGKGPSAAIPVASIITVLREAQLQKLNMTDTLRQLNSRLISLYHHHITSSVAAVSLFADGHCTLYNAGSPGWFSHAPGQTNYFMLRSNPLGLTEHCRIAQYSFDLPQHSTLITFTDGYLEGSRELNRFLKKLQRTAHTGTLSTEILESHISTCRDQRLSDDDQSLLLVRSA